MRRSRMCKDVAGIALLRPVQKHLPQAQVQVRVPSVTCTPPCAPPVRHHMSQLSTVPMHASPAATASATAGTFSSSHSHFTPLQRARSGASGGGTRGGETRRCAAPRSVRGRPAGRPHRLLPWWPAWLLTRPCPALPCPALSCPPITPLIPSRSAPPPQPCPSPHTHSAEPHRTLSPQPQPT